MVILHVSGLSGNKSAGPTFTVTKNVEYGNKLKHDVALYNLYDNNLDEFIDKDKIFLLKDFPSISLLPKPFNNPDIVIFQSMYIKQFVHVYKELKKNKIPYVVTPRGSLTRKAQKKKKFKKVIGNLLFFNRFIKNASLINFLTENEYIESKCFKFKKYFINGNGIDIKGRHKNFDNTNNKFVVTFIGRIEWYHKGLDYLVEAINCGKDEFRKRNFVFNLYGPDSFNSYNKLNMLIKKYDISDLISINGPVFGDEKERILLNTDLFIHTSRLEGQPNSVIEAISYGIPVFVTPGTNIDKEVEINGLGFTSKYNINDIKENLLKAYVLKEKFPLISKKEIEYSFHNFDWNVIVKKNCIMYAEIVKNVR